MARRARISLASAHQHVKAYHQRGQRSGSAALAWHRNISWHNVSAGCGVSAAACSTSSAAALQQNQRAKAAAISRSHQNNSISIAGSAISALAGGIMRVAWRRGNISINNKRHQRAARGEVENKKKRRGVGIGSVK